MTSTRSRAVARRAHDGSVVRFAARLGFAASGIVHLLIGAIAIEVAVGSRAPEADQSGALGQLASSPGGGVLLWVLVVGFGALGLWLVANAFLLPTGERSKRVSHFVTNFAKGVVYLVLCLTALTFARGGSTSSASSTGTASGDLLASPGGAVVLVVIGVGVFAVGLYLLVKGVRQKFTDDLRLPRGTAGRVTVVLGTVGYVAKAVALGAVGILFVVAAVTGDAAQANGLDGALKSLASLPFGVVILVVVGLGLIAYGLYSFVRARLAQL